MHNISTRFECEVENLFYATIERETAHYFNMGSPTIQVFHQKCRKMYLTNLF